MVSSANINTQTTQGNLLTTNLIEQYKQNAQDPQKPSDIKKEEDKIFLTKI